MVGYTRRGWAADINTQTARGPTGKDHLSLWAHQPHPTPPPPDHEYIIMPSRADELVIGESGGRANGHVRYNKYAARTDRRVTVDAIILIQRYAAFKRHEQTLVCASYLSQPIIKYSSSRVHAYTADSATHN